MTMLRTFQFLRMLLEGKLRAERCTRDLAFADIGEALLKKLGFQRLVLVPSYVLQGVDSQKKAPSKQRINGVNMHCVTWWRIPLHQHHRGNLLVPQVF